MTPYLATVYTIFCVVLNGLSGFTSMRDSKISVFYGGAGQQHVAILKSEVGIPLDIAYNPAKKCIDVLAKFQSELRIRRWSTAGTLLSEWKLPAKLGPGSVLFMHGDQLSTIMWEGNQTLLISIDSHRTSGTSIEESPVDYDEFDEKLNPQRLKVIRELMRNLKWVPELRSGDIGNPMQLIDSFHVNVPRLNDHISWTHDYALLGFGWDEPDISLNLAIRISGNNYHNVHVYRILLRFLKRHAHSASNIRNRLLSVVVSGRQAVFGITDTNASNGQFVLWLDLSSNWRITRQAKGYIARTIEQY